MFTNRFYHGCYANSHFAYEETGLERLRVMQSLGGETAYLGQSDSRLCVWLLCLLLWWTCPDNNRLWTRQAKCLWWSLYSSMEHYWIEEEKLKYWELKGHFWFSWVSLLLPILAYNLWPYIGWLVLFHKKALLFLLWKIFQDFSNTKMRERSSRFWT